MKPKQISLRYRFSFLCVLAIVVLSLYPVQETPLKNVTLSDKWAHFLMYGGLSAIVSTETLRKGKSALGSVRLTALHLAIRSLLLPTLLGILMEFAQAFLTTYRSGEVLDALANTLGALIAYLLALLVLFLTRNSSRKISDS